MPKSPSPHKNPAKFTEKRLKERCAVTQQSLSAPVLRLGSLRPGLAAAIQNDHPGLLPDAPLSPQIIARYRMQEVEDLLRDERGELSDLEHDVATSIAHHETIASNPEEDFEEKRTFGEWLADHIASFGGSWSFIISFCAFMAIWITANVLLLAKPFDAYPFILLNLMLSCLAALQAPIIMMSQNRQESKDRLRSENDYRVNLKAELEIRLLHEKIDQLVAKQWDRFGKIQHIQTELLHDLLPTSPVKKSKSTSKGKK